MHGANPFTNNNTIRYHIDAAAQVNVSVYDENGKQITVLVNKNQPAGTYTQNWNTNRLGKGIYFIQVAKNGVAKQSIKVVKG